MRVTPSAEFSHELPIANSSQFAFPIGIAPASSIRATAVAVYGATQCSKNLAAARRARAVQTHVIFDGERHARERQAASPAANALVDACRLCAREIGEHRQDTRRQIPSTAPTCASVARRLRRRCTRRERTARAISAALRSTNSSATARLLRDDPRHAEERALPLRRLRPARVRDRDTGAARRRASRCATRRPAPSPGRSRCRARRAR